MRSRCDDGGLLCLLRFLSTQAQVNRLSKTVISLLAPGEADGDRRAGPISAELASSGHLHDEDGDLYDDGQFYARTEDIAEFSRRDADAFVGLERGDLFVTGASFENFTQRVRDLSRLPSSLREALERRGPQTASAYLREDLDEPATGEYEVIIALQKLGNS